MKVRLFFCCGLFTLSVALSAFASWNKKPEFRWQQLYRYEMRRNRHRLYNNRLSATFNYSDEKGKSLFKMAPFFEIRRNLVDDLWERKELGIEMGKDIFAWVYVGEALQKGWMKEDYRYYTDYEKRNYFESEARLLLSHNLLSSRCIKLKGFILNEYTYDFDEGRGMRNELAVGLVMPVGKYIETGLSWRHIDRVHYYDSDTFETSVTAVF